MTRAIVCGGRDYSDRERVFAVLDRAVERLGLDFVIQGAAAGADSLASAWAHSRGVQQAAYPAKWRTYGKAAGVIRNQQMLDEGKPDFVIAFPGGVGTDDMCRRAAAAGVTFYRLR